VGKALTVCGRAWLGAGTVAQQGERINCVGDRTWREETAFAYGSDF